MKTIAVLLTCHNRRLITLYCLKSLFDCQIPNNHTFDVFLVDDGSTDGTTKAIQNEFPEVKIIQGNGNLFWNQGMRLAWKTAAQSNDYDFYFWLNDDTILDCDTIIKFIETYQEILFHDSNPGVLCGACRDADGTTTFSYGGRNDSGPVYPNGQLQRCKYINGNAVLVPKEIFNSIGILSPNYTHIWGDLDYGLRAQKNGYPCYTTKTYIATCPPNIGIPAWCNPETPIKMRLKLLHSPKGLNISEYIIYRKRFWGWKWIIYAVKAYLKSISPRLYANISKTN